MQQVVMLKAWKVLPEFDYEQSKGRFRNWLAVITRNEARTFLRKKYRQFDLEGGERQEALKTLSDSWQDPEIEKISKERVEKVYRYFGLGKYFRKSFTEGQAMLRITQ